MMRLIMNLIELRSALLLLYLLLLHFKNGASKSIIKTLPGFKGDLPFKLETGYIGVGENEEVQLFYYFVESQNDPKTDPLVFWFTGGPGCSALFSVSHEMGPFKIDSLHLDGELPTIVLNPYSWIKVANMLHIDNPVGTGYSYANTLQGYYSSDSKSSKDSYTFLKKWLLDHPMFIKNPLYVGGGSYGGKLTGMVVMEIIKGNDAGHLPQISLQGYLVGNGLTDTNIDYNARVPYAYHMGLISNEYFESARISCGGKYYNSDPNNRQCQYAIRRIQKCLRGTNKVHILEPECGYLTQKHYTFGWDQTFSEDDSDDHLVLPTIVEECNKKDDIENPMADWASKPIIQEALHVRKDTITSWLVCNNSVAYVQDVDSVLQYHKFFSKRGYRALVYNGDHDISAPFLGPLKWIPTLNLTVDENWRPWFVNGQIAGYTMRHMKNDFSLTYATIKGAGHEPPTYKPKQSLVMFSRWINGLPL